MDIVLIILLFFCATSIRTKTTPFILRKMRRTLNRYASLGKTFSSFSYVFQEIYVTFSVEEPTNYLLSILLALLLGTLVLIICGIPFRNFPRAQPRSIPQSPPITASPPQHQPKSPLNQTPPIASSSITPSNQYLTPQTPSTSTASYSQTPSSVSSPSSPQRFSINTNQNFYESQRLRGPRF